jgi:hypothetical protein
MEVIWSEHVKGGRSKPYEHLQELVKVKPKVKPTGEPPAQRLPCRLLSGVTRLGLWGPVGACGGRGRLGVSEKPPAALASAVAAPSRAEAGK